MTIGRRISKTGAAMGAVLLVTCAPWAYAGAAGQQSSPAPQKPPLSGPAVAAPAANPADFGSIDAILRATYDTISGPAGKQRDWNRFRSLFVPGARLIPVVSDHQGGFRVAPFSVEEYIAHGDAHFQKNSFFEREMARRTEHYGNMAQVFSTYESRHNAADPKPFERGINSFQLMNDGRRWWIVTIFWQGETAGSPIPEEFSHGVR